MALNIRKFTSGIQLIGQSSTIIDAAGELQYNSTLNKFVLNNGTSSSPIVSESHAATLTNKTISGSSNTLTNIGLSSLGTTTANRLLATNGSGQPGISTIVYNNDNTVKFAEGSLSSPSITMGPNATGFYKDVSVGGDTINFVNNGLLTGGITWQTYPTQLSWFLGNNDLLTSLSVSGPQLALNSSDTSVQQDNAITGGNNFADTLVISADTQPNASQGGCIKLYARSATQPHVTEFYNSGFLSGRITNVSRLQWSDGDPTSPAYSFMSGTGYGLYYSGGIQFAAAGANAGSLIAGVWNLGAIGGSGSHKVNGFLTVQGTGTGQFIVKDTVSHATTGAPSISFTDASTTLGQIGFPTPNTYTLRLNTVNALGNYDFQINSSSIGSINNSGKWTIGASAGSQIHDVNGGLKTTQAITLPEISTPSTPSSGNGKIYFKSDGFLYQLNDDGTETKVGAGSGGINYITNPDAESNVTGWATYADAAGVTPVDGTGGSANVTITRSTSSPLRGTGSFLLTKDAANRQGQGVSYDFTIADADKAKPLSVSFNYSIASGTFTSGDSSDLRVYLYDVTNAQVIQPSPYTIQGGSGSNHRFLSTFQTASNSNSYRLIIHVATTSTSAYTYKFDDVSVGPQTLNYGSPVTDWQTYSPILSGQTNGLTFSNQTSTGRYRRNGDSLDLQIYTLFSGAPGTGTGNFQWSLPSGLTIDTTKLALASNQVVGQAAADDAGVARAGDANTYVVSSTQLGALSATGGIYNSGFAFNWNTGDSIILYNIKVPISGWSSTVEMSNDTDTRVVAARANTSISTINNTTPIVVCTSADYDTHGAYSTSTGRYTVQVPGYYKVTAGLRFGSQSYGAGNVVELYIYKNGSSYSILDRLTFTASTTQTAMIDGTDTVKCEAGDIIDIRAYNDVSTALAGGGTGNHVAFERVSGPSAIAASEKVVARYNSNNTDTIGSEANTIVNFEDRIIDTHSAVTIGASWKFTAPKSGYYKVSSTVESAVTSWSVTHRWGIRLYKNGTAYSYLGINYIQAAANINICTNGTDIVQLNAGDYIDIRADQNTGGNVGTGNNAQVKYISIESI